MNMDRNILDLSKVDKTYYTAANTPQLVQFEELPYLAIVDKGAPESVVFTNATEALYTVAYGVKSICKKVNKDFTIAKLEGLWWVESDKDALEVPREEWQWKLLIRMPDFVSDEIVENARVNASIKKKDLEQIHRVTFETIWEGACVQMMHIGKRNNRLQRVLRVDHGELDCLFSSQIRDFDQKFIIKRVIALDVRGTKQIQGFQSNKWNDIRAFPRS